ncbi:MAG TPA: hypothetical protein VGH10_14145, partial [Actinomycetota bacterium]
YLCAKICANELRLEHALGWIRRSVDRDPTLAPAHYLHGLILTELGEMDDAMEALRRCMYLDPHFVLGHFALAGVFERLQRSDRARKALENVTALLAGRAPDELLAEGDGVTVGRLLELAAVQMQLARDEIQD